MLTAQLDCLLRHRRACNQRASRFLRSHSQKVNRRFQVLPFECKLTNACNRRSASKFAKYPQEKYVEVYVLLLPCYGTFWLLRERLARARVFRPGASSLVTSVFPAQDGRQIPVSLVAHICLLVAVMTRTPALFTVCIVIPVGWLLRSNFADCYRSTSALRYGTPDPTLHCVNSARRKSGVGSRGAFSTSQVKHDYVEEGYH